MFVTWKSKGSLRGCIGNFSSSPLLQGLANTCIDGRNDSRFSPINSGELASLTCKVSLLTEFEPCADHLDWENRQARH